MYLNKVTPQKNNTSTSALKVHYESFSSNLIDKLHQPDSSTISSSTCNLATIDALIYISPPTIEPDSTSEGKEEPQPPPQLLPLPLPKKSKRSDGSQQYWQYLTDPTNDDTLDGGPPDVVSGLETLLDKPFKCPFPDCSYRVKHRRNLNRHKKQKHGTITSNGIRIVMKHVCNICGAFNLNYSNFKRHHDAKDPEMLEDFTEKPFEFVAYVDEPSADVDDKIKNLSKSAAQLETALEFHREVPFVSSAYSLSEPLPFGDTDFSILDGKKSVNLPAKSVSEVNDLNEILKNEDAHKKAVREAMVSHILHNFRNWHLN